jgi:regulation of enolase protein 1 (concanavalin A-like superfamily)
MSQSPRRPSMPSSSIATVHSARHVALQRACRATLETLEQRRLLSTVDIGTTVIGTTPQYMGFNPGDRGGYEEATHFGDPNVYGTSAFWLKQMGTNMMRLWGRTHLDEGPIAGQTQSNDNGPQGNGVIDQATFDAAKAVVIANPTGNTYINWLGYDLAKTQHGEEMLQIGIDPVAVIRYKHNGDVASVIGADTDTLTTWPARWEWWEYCYAMAYLHGTQGTRFFEIGNEPEFGIQGGLTPEQQVEAIQWGHDALRAGYQAATGKTDSVIMAAGTNEKHYVDYIHANAGQWLDAISIHTYQSQYDRDQQSRELTQDLPASVPVYNTETGYRTSEPFRQARETFNMVRDDRIDSLLIWKTSNGASGGLLKPTAQMGLWEPNDGYYSLRLVYRGTVGAKQMYSVTSSDSLLVPLVTKDASHTYITLHNAGGAARTYTVGLPAWIDPADLRHTYIANGVDLKDQAWSGVSVNGTELTVTAQPGQSMVQIVFGDAPLSQLPAQYDPAQWTQGHLSDIYIPASTGSVITSYSDPFDTPGDTDNVYPTLGQDEVASFDKTHWIPRAYTNTTIRFRSEPLRYFDRLYLTNNHSNDGSAVDMLWHRNQHKFDAATPLILDLNTGVDDTTTGSDPYHAIVFRDNNGKMVTLTARPNTFSGIWRLNTADNPGSPDDLFDTGVSTAIYSAPNGRSQLASQRVRLTLTPTTVRMQVWKDDGAVWVDSGEVAHNLTLSGVGRVGIGKRGYNPLWYDNVSITGAAAGTVQPPAAPSNLAAAAASSSQINLTWTDNSSDETGFELDRATNSAFTAGLTTINLAAGATSHSDTGLAASTTYYYRARATNSGGDSSNSATASATTQAAPTGGTVTRIAEADSFVRGGTFASENYGLATALNVKNDSSDAYDRQAYFRFDLAGLGTVTAAQLHLMPTSVGSAAGSTTFRLELVATDTWIEGNGGTDNTPSGELTWNNKPAASTILAEWTGVTAGTAQVIDLTSAVQQQLADGKLSVRLWSTTVGSNNWANFGSRESTTEANRPRLVITTSNAPAAPSNVTATAVSPYQIDVGWTDNASNETGFEVQYSTDSTFATGVTTLTAGVNATSLSLNDLAAGTTYHVRVRATGADGNSAYATASATTETVQYLDLRTLTFGPYDSTQDFGNISISIDGSTATLTGNSWKQAPFTYSITPETVLEFEVTATDAGELLAIGFDNDLTYSNTPYRNFVLAGSQATPAQFIDVRSLFTGPGPQRVQIPVGQYFTGSAGRLVMLVDDDADASGNVAFRNVRLFETGVSAPLSPTNLAAAAQSSTAINLTWTDNAVNETGYRIERATAEDFSGEVEVFNVGADATSFSDTGLNPSTTYYYQVRATNSAGDSAYSNTASATTAAAVPAAPSGASATAISPSQINLSWVDNSDNETGFAVDRATNSAFTAGLTSFSVGAGVTAFASTGLAASTTYYYRVRATGTAGNSANSNTASASTPAASSVITRRAEADTYINASSSTNTWGQATTLRVNNSSNSIYDYFTYLRFDVSQLGQLSSALLNLQPLTTTSSSANTTFTLKFIASDTWNEDTLVYSTRPATGATLATWTGEAVGTARIVDLTSIVQQEAAGDGKLSLMIEASYTGGTANISYGSDEATDPAQRPALVIQPAQTDPPQAPSSVTATPASTTQVNLTWIDNADDETAYRVERSTNSGFQTGVTTFNLPAGSTSFNDTGLSASTIYYYRVIATNSAGESDPTDPLLAITHSVGTDWTSQDIGGVAAAGSSSYAAPVWTVNGSGADIWGTADEFRYVYKPWTGDGVLIARVVSVENTNEFAKAGVMFRETLAANSRQVSILATPANGLRFTRRVSTGGTSTSTAASVTNPEWVRLVRRGDLFEAYRSNDGQNWTFIAQQTVTMTQAVYVGLAVTSHADGNVNTSTFEHFGVSADATLVPPFDSQSYIGGTGADDGVWASEIAADGTIIMAGRIGDSTPGGVAPILLNGATATTTGAVVRLSPDGKTVLSVTRLASTLIRDISLDAAGNIYVAATNDGAFKLDPTASTILWSHDPGTADRIDAAPDGHFVFLQNTWNTNEIDTANGAGTLFVYSPSHTLLGQFAGHNRTQDVAIDDGTQSVFGTGFKNETIPTGHSQGPNQPVQVGYIRSWSYVGATNWTGYDWDGSLLADYEADHRGYRVEIGGDGLLYAAFSSDGGDPALLRDPFNLAIAAPIVGGGAYHDWYNTAAERKLFWGRYEPSTGNLLLAQRLTARTSSGAGASISVSSGSIQADAQGRVYIGAGSGGTLPYTFDPYGGDGKGAFFLVMSADFSQRLYFGHVSTTGGTRAVAARIIGDSSRPNVFWGGRTSQTNLFSTDPIQALISGTEDGFFGAAEKFRV